MKLKKIDRYITAQERKHANALLADGVKVGQWYKVNNSKYFILINNKKTFKVERRYNDFLAYGDGRVLERKNILEFIKVT